MGFFKNIFNRGRGQQQPTQKPKSGGFFGRIFGGKGQQHDKPKSKIGGFFQVLFNRKKQEPMEEPESVDNIDEVLDQIEKETEEVYQDLLTQEEKKKKEEEEKEEKEADTRDREAEREKSRETFNERYGTDWEKEAYDQFWDTFGDATYTQVFGSQVLIYMAEMSMDSEIPFPEFVRMVDEVVSEAQGQGWNQQDAADALYRKIQGYKHG